MPGYISAPALIGRLGGVVGGAASAVPMVQSILNPKDNIITALQNFGTAVENQFAPPGQKRGYVGSNPVAVAGNRGLGLVDIGSRPVVNPEFLRPDYSGAGERARRFQEYKTGMDIPGANTDYSDRLAPAQNTPLNRSYQQEASRVAQMTEQDPLFKKYQVADLTKAYNTAKTPEEKERIGLQIWATTNPSLASRLRPGQTGYQTSAAMSGSQVFGKDIPGITQTFYQQASEQAGVPFPGASQAASMNAFGLGANAQQLGVSAPGQIPPTMIGEDVFKRGIQPPSSEDLTQTQLALLKRAFEGRLK
jgi:hypothetical protein